jgi:multidrug efflux system membrane fusion protein
MTDPNAPTGTVRLSFVDPIGTLTIETPVSVEILIDQRTGAIIVPAAAIQKDDLSSYVMVAGEDQRAHRRDVRTGLVTRDFAQVMAGLEPGERVIVGGLADVSEGTAISFVE